MGHTALTCWYHFDHSYTTSPPSTFEAYVTTSTLPAPSTEWFLDSGATHHVTGDLNNLSSFAFYNSKDQLQIGNGMGMHIKHIGFSNFSVSKHTIHLSNILHVPMFTKNLLSLTQLLHDNDLTITFSSNSCVVKDRRTNTILLQAKSLNGLYSFKLPLIINSISPQAFLGECVSAEVCHARFGHPSYFTTLHVLNAY